MASTQRQKIEWYTDIMPRATKRALDYLAKQQWLKKSQWYLAGGTALALQGGHRQSVDLDFFVPQKSFSQATLIRHFPDAIFKSYIIREGTIFATLYGAKASFIAYPFFLPAQSPIYYGAVRVLHRADIAVMKIIAISQRGRKRDFVDLYWYCMHYERLEEIMRRVASQYPNIEHNYHHIIKSLTYFDEAEEDPMPTLFFKADWKTIKAFFRKEAMILARQLLGII